MEINEYQKIKIIIYPDTELQIKKAPVFTKPLDSIMN